MGSRELTEIKPACCRKKVDTENKPGCCKKNTVIDDYDSFKPLLTSSFSDISIFGSLPDEELENKNENVNNIKYIDFNAIGNTSSHILPEQSPERSQKKVSPCCRKDVELIKKKLIEATRKKNFDNIKSQSLQNKSKLYQNDPMVNMSKCCKGKVKPVEEKVRDTTITSVPHSVARNFHSSTPKSHPYPMQRGYGAPGYYTNYAPLRTYPRNQNLNYSTYSPRSHVPKPSRNYHTYDDDQPKYFSTPLPSAFQNRGRFNKSWGSSVDANLTMNQTQRSRQNAYRSANYLSQTSRSTQSDVPRVDRLYANPNISRQANAYIYNRARNQNSPVYNQNVTARSYNPNSGNYSYEDSNMASFFERAQSSPIQRPQSTPIQRPQQLLSNSAIPSIAANSPPCSRPKTAEPASGLPACCRGVGDRPRTAEARNGNIEKYYSERSCYKKSPKTESFCNDNTCNKFGQMSNNTQTSLPQNNVSCQCGAASDKYNGVYDQGGNEEGLDTLLEIRTPHQTPGEKTRTPLLLSINVSCADRSVVITPDKGYNAISSDV